MTPHLIRSRALIRKAGVLAASGALAAASLAVTTAPAHAATGDLTCMTAAVLSFSPALTPGGSATMSANALARNCKSLNDRFPKLNNAVITASGKATAQKPGVDQCPVLLTSTGTGTFKWNTGATSTFSFTINTNPDKTITISAKVTSGPLNGDTVNADPATATVNTDCATNGLKTLTTDVQLVFG
ncbi:hypothetical protein [Streptomyces sp. NPDC001404]|uniref:hypothetical protein n=1 Tax=Streptomyces sp. NPDC001404 TaxID=3364571 RepID=UPI00368D87D3